MQSQAAQNALFTLQTFWAKRQTLYVLRLRKKEVYLLFIKLLSRCFICRTTATYVFFALTFASFRIVRAEDNSTVPSAVSEYSSDFLISHFRLASYTQSANVSRNHLNKTETPSVGLSVLIGFISIFTVLGNSLVITSIAIFRKLRKIPNMFIVSLATADLIMGGLVLGVGSHYVIGSRWLLGSFVCDIWTSVDVLSVTASICTLCAISLDRFVAITMPFQYSHKMTRHRARFIIGFIWILSAAIAFIPINLGWWKTDDPDDIKCYEDPHCCEFRTNRTYAIVTSLISFYIPLIVMICAYSVVFKIAIQKRTKIRNREGVFRRASMPGSRALLWGRGEYRAVFTMAIIMGTFVACWLPFFVVNVVQVFCHRCVTSNMFTILNWFGYANSFFNPIIYCHSKEFRRAFKRLLFCGLCREGYQRTSRASLSIPYIPSFSVRPSLRTDSGIFKLSNIFLSNSQGRPSSVDSQPRRFKKPGAKNGQIKSSSMTGLCNGLTNGASIYGQRSSRYDCDSQSESSLSSNKEESLSNQLYSDPEDFRESCEANEELDHTAHKEAKKITWPQNPIYPRKQILSDSMAICGKEPAHCKHLIFKTLSHNDICENRSNRPSSLHLIESAENSSKSSTETVVEQESVELEAPLLQNKGDINNKSNNFNLDSFNDAQL